MTRTNTVIAVSFTAQKNQVIFKNIYEMLLNWARNCTENLCDGWLWLRSRASVSLSEGCWFSPSGLHVEVSFGKILNTKLHLMCWSAHCIAAITISVWMYVWITGSCFEQECLLYALNVDVVTFLWFYNNEMSQEPQRSHTRQHLGWGPSRMILWPEHKKKKKKKKTHKNTPNRNISQLNVKGKCSCI